MALRYDIDFEVGDFSEWENDSSDGDETVVAPGLASSNFRCKLTYSPALFVAKVWNDMGLLAGIGNIMRFGFIIRIDAMNFSASVTTFSWSTLGNLWQIRVVDGGSGTYDIACTYQIDGGSVILTANVGMLDGTEHNVEIRAQRSSADGIGDGEFQLYVDGTLEDSATTVDNYSEYNSSKINQFQLHPPNIFGRADPGGGMSVDGVIFRDDDTPIYPSGTTTWELRELRFASISPDGTHIMAPAQNVGGGTVELLKIFTDMITDTISKLVETDEFAVMHGPEIGTLWVAGINILQYSTDDGDTWTDVLANLSATAEMEGRSFFVGPDTYERILLFDLDAEENQETEDAGATWALVSTATVGTQTIIIQRSLIFKDEVVAGGDTTDMLIFSQNGLIHWGDLTTINGWNPALSTIAWAEIS